MSAGTADRLQEWRAHWTLVLASFVGVSFPTAAYYSLGLFIEPMTREFGWSRTQISVGPSVAGLVIIPLAPLVGAMVDRWGARLIVLPGAVLTALAIAGFGLANGSYAQWVLLWSLFALASVLLKTTVWTTAISGSFDAGRSLALAVVLSGTALATSLAPPLARWLTDSFGWRSAWMLLGCGWGVPVLILCALFIRDARDRQRRAGRSSRPESAAPVLPGLTLGEAARSLPILRIGLATLITLLLSSALVVHKVPLLEDAGVSRATAGYLASLSGIAGILGSLTTGWLMERFNAGWIAGLTNGITAVALIFLLAPFRTPTLIVVAMVVVGYAGGTKLQICAYLTSLYAGLRHYGKIFGVMGSIIAVTGAIGPLIGGLAYDYAGSYDALIIAGIPASLISALLIIGLGPYPDWKAA
ncbi:MAG TPA: MFS transporter [Sphingobium sp.]|nr:MFS transporter [Sphingobium sp.]